MGLLPTSFAIRIFVPVIYSRIQGTFHRGTKIYALGSPVSHFQLVLKDLHGLLDAFDFCPYLYLRIFCECQGQQEENVCEESIKVNGG